MLLLLCLCLQQFKTRHFHLILLSNLLYSTLTLVCVVVTVIVLMNWKVICNTCSRQIAKYSQTLNYLLEIISFPSVFIIKLFLHLLEPLYKTCLQFKSTSKYSLVQYFWSLASKVFFPLLWLHAFYCITASCLTLQQFNLWQWKIQFPFTSSHYFPSDHICSTLLISGSFVFGNCNNSW